MRNKNIATFQLEISRDKVFLLLAMFFLCWHPRPLGSETLRLTTYYPSPFGGYVSLLTTGKTLLARDASRVGVGMGNPSAKLEVLSPAGGAEVGLLVNGRIETGDANLNGGVWFSDAQDAGIGTNGAYSGFRTSGSDWEALSIKRSDGNTGIGTSAPTKRLDIRGNVRIGTMLGGASGALYGLCHVQSAGIPCAGGASLMVVFGNECAAGGYLYIGDEKDHMDPAYWVPHTAMLPSCPGAQATCCRIFASD